MDLTISRDTVSALRTLKDKFLLLEQQLYVIKDFVIEERFTSHKSFFGKESKNITYYLTSCTVAAWHSKGKFLGVLPDESAESFVFIYNLYVLRQNYLNFKEMLKAFGYELTKIEKK